ASAMHAVEMATRPRFERRMASPPEDASRRSTLSAVSSRMLFPAQLLYQKAWLDPTSSVASGERNFLAARDRDRIARPPITMNDAPPSISRRAKGLGEGRPRAYPRPMRARPLARHIMVAIAGLGASAPMGCSKGPSAPDGGSKSDSAPWEARIKAADAPSS